MEQTLAPLELVVVNNASPDGTSAKRIALPSVNLESEFSRRNDQRTYLYIAAAATLLFEHRCKWIMLQINVKRPRILITATDNESAWELECPWWYVVARLTQALSKKGANYEDAQTTQTFG